MKISVAKSVKSKSWEVKEFSWPQFLEVLKTPKVTTETLEEYLKLPKEEQLALKDVGAYLGGELSAEQRKRENLQNRCILTLDVDFACQDFFELALFCFFEETFILHSTRKHTSENPRFRLIVPLSRPVSAAEYEAIARIVAFDLGMSHFDKSTFEPSRAMFFPSISKGSEYVFKVAEGVPLDVQRFLNRYVNWEDVRLWPRHPEEPTDLDFAKLHIKTQADPLKKQGLIGQFCRTYDIHAAISAFLPHIYAQESGNRYTYVEGTTQSGLVIYEGKFAYSHHGTDPSAGQLCNAFDLVRIHLFGEFDKEKQVDPAKRESFVKMLAFVSENTEVRATAAEEAREMFGVENLKTLPPAQENPTNYADYEVLPTSVLDTILPAPVAQPNEWLASLETSKNGSYKSSARNVELIFSNDPALAGAFGYDTFSSTRMLMKSTPWREIKNPEPINDSDYAAIRLYFENIYQIEAVRKIEDVLTLSFDKNSYHPIRQYLSALRWDGEKRLDTTLHKVFGVEKSEYAAQVFRKTMVALVARVFEPGIKFDNILTLVGKQGVYKSTFFRKLGQAWFSDTFSTLQGKDAFEQLQGSWLIELAELSATKKSDVETIKHFFSKTSDRYRPAYGRTVVEHKRQCVLVASTNCSNFLKDPTGNRRFWPVTVRAEHAQISVVSKEFDEMIPQLFAEAVQLYLRGEKLYLDEETSAAAETVREFYFDEDERQGAVEDFINLKLPEEWADWSLPKRRSWAADPELCRTGTQQRKSITAAEIYCEFLGNDLSTMTKYNTRDINDMLKILKGWSQSPKRKHYKIYGRQRTYEREEVGG